MISLYRHQQIALNYLRFNDSFMLFMEQGTGKTLPTLARILELLLTDAIQNCLVVCPKSVIGSWERDMEKFTPKQQLKFKKVTVINYDKVWRGNTFNKVWDCIVLDEAHSIKNRTSKRSEFLLKLSLSAKYRYLLTGTPISNGRLENIWSLITFLKPYKNGRSICSEIFRDEAKCGRGSYYDWCDKYAYLDQFHNPYQYHNIEEVQRIINSYSFRITKDKCIDLPAKLPDEIMSIELIGGKKVYNDIAKKSASLELDFVAENPLVRLTKLRQLASGFFMKEDEVKYYPCEKDEALAEFLDGYDKKLVIFAEFKESITKLKAMMESKKIKYVVLDGEQKDKTIWRKFQNEADIQVIICQYQSACQGIDLYASSLIIYYEPTIRSNILEQSRDRIHRNGQKVACSYIHLITKGTIEQAIYKALIGYSDFSDKLFNQYLQEYQRSRR